MTMEYHRLKRPLIVQLDRNVLTQFRGNRYACKLRLYGKTAVTTIHQYGYAHFSRQAIPGQHLQSTKHRLSRKNYVIDQQNPASLHIRYFHLPLLIHIQGDGGHLPITDP